MTSSLKIPLAIALSGVIVAFAIYASMPQRQSTGSSASSSLVRSVNSSDHIFGNPAARVMIVEYADFECGPCKGFYETLRQIVANEGVKGEVAWTLRAFPLSELHKNAFSSARAAECVAKVAGNDAFWKFADALFAHQPTDPLSYGAFAKEAGVLGADAFSTCYMDATEIVDDRINADRQNALDAGASGAPYSLILVAGKPPVVMDGAYPYGAVKALVDQALE